MSLNKFLLTACQLVSFFGIAMFVTFFFYANVSAFRVEWIYFILALTMFSLLIFVLSTGFLVIQNSIDTKSKSDNKTSDAVAP